MKVGVYGGVFDPPHRGHVALAQAAVQSGNLDRLVIVPTNHPPHKRMPATAFAHRMAMVLLAFPRENSFFSVSVLEAETRVHYTCDTLRAVAEQHPGAELFFIVGADSLEQIPFWRNWKDILTLAGLLAAERPGTERDSSRICPEVHERTTWIEGLVPCIASSTAIRNGLAAGDHSVWQMLPDPVSEYIRQHQLYGVK